MWPHGINPPNYGNLPTLEWRKLDPQISPHQSKLSHNKWKHFTNHFLSDRRETRGSGIDEIGESKLSNIFNFFSPPSFSPNFCYRAGFWSIYSWSPVARGLAWRRKTLFFIGMGRFRAFIGIKKIGINVCTNIPVLFFYWRIIRVNPLCQLHVTLLSYVIVAFVTFHPVLHFSLFIV